MALPLLLRLANLGLLLQLPLLGHLPFHRLNVMLLIVLDQVEHLDDFLQVPHSLLLPIEREVPKLSAFAPLQTNASPQLARVAPHLNVSVLAGSDESRGF